ncbi:MAG TPA: response regulator, partial [Lacipirellulaceae bacterium]|nr:response regulator [Lacipirellulaceae bacterium]
MNTEPTVFIVDDDAAALDSLDCLLRSVGLQVQAYSSPSQFLQEYDPTRPGCIVLDVRMPELSGLELQQELLLRGSAPPILVVTGH